MTVFPQLQPDLSVLLKLSRTLAVLVLALSCNPLLAAVEVTGVSSEITDAIVNSVSLDEPCNQDRWLVRYRFRDSEQEVRSVLQTYGYYSPNISSKLVFEEGCWSARFDIDAGAPSRIRLADYRVVGEGAGHPDFERVLQAPNLQAGERFDHEEYESFKRRFEDVAAKLGFRNSKFTTRTALVTPLEQAVDVTLEFDTGVRFRFGEITFESPRLRQSLLDRYLKFSRGDPYDAGKLTELYQALAASTYFEDIIINSGEPIGQEIPIDVNLVTGDSSLTRVGVGYSTDLGPSAFVARSSRIINDRGHQLNLDAMVSPVEKKVGGYYRIPQSSVAEGWYSVYGGFLQENTDTSETIKSTLGVRHIRPRGGGWVETRFFEILNYEFDIASDQRSNLSFVPGLSFSHTRVNDTSARPTSAHRLDFEISGASTSFGSTVNFLHLSASAKVVQELGENFRVIGRGKVGAVLNDDVAGLPPDVRFFAGGDNSVRGYDFEEIGALDANGLVIGGDRLIEASIEFDYRFLPSWAVATFVDAGSVSVSAFSDTFKRSAGVGVRWYSPIGPVRFDIAKPLFADEHSVRIHITLGPDI